MNTKLLIGLSVIVLLIYIAHHFVRHAKLVSIFHHLSFSTAIFMIIGILIGPSGFGLFKSTDMGAFAPLLDILLGWIGWLIGIELTRKMISIIPNKYWVIGMTENLITLLITVLFFAGMESVFGSIFPERFSLPFLLLIGLCAAISSPRSIITLTRKMQIPRDIVKSYAVVAHLGNLGVMLMMYLFINFFDYGVGVTSFFVPTMKMLALGITQGLMMSWLFHYRRDTPESMLIVIGVITFFSGMAVFLHVPALLTGLIGGGFFAYWFPNQQPHLHLILQQSERPIFLLFVTVASISIPVFSLALYLFLIPFLLFRTIAKLTSGVILKNRLSQRIKGEWNIGIFLPQGALAIAIALSAFQLSPNVWGELLVAVVVIGLLVNELLGYQIIRMTNRSVSYE